MAARGDRRRARLRDRQAPRFALFGETLMTGIVVLIASIPLVTAVAALAAGSRHLRRHAIGEGDSIRVLVIDFARAVRKLWLLGIIAFALVAFLLVDAWALGGLDIPGGQVVAVALVVVGAAAAIVLLRFVGSWGPEHGVRSVLRRAGAESLTDPVGSLLLLLSAAAAVIVVWMFPALVLIVGGLLCLAAYGVDARLEAISAE